MNHFILVELPNNTQVMFTTDDNTIDDIKRIDGTAFVFHGNDNPDACCNHIVEMAKQVESDQYIFDIDDATDTVIVCAYCALVLAIDTLLSDNRGRGDAFTESLFIRLGKNGQITVTDFITAALNGKVKDRKNHYHVGLNTTFGVETKKPHLSLVE